MRWPQYRQLTELNAMVCAPSEAALAAVIGVPADGLAATLQGVAAMVGGADDPFGRVFANQHRLAAPFFAIRVTGALFHTQGGLVVDENAQVRRIDGSLIVNLFAGGGAARSVSGPGVWGYLPAMGLCMSMTLGRLAGRQAARLTLPKGYTDG
jgi:fumarate reductase flavoprotein subunit